MTNGHLPSSKLEDAFVRAIGRQLSTAKDRSERLTMARAIRDEIDLVLRAAPHGEHPAGILIDRVTLGAVLGAAMTRVINAEIANLSQGDQRL